MSQTVSFHIPVDQSIKDIGETIAAMEEAERISQDPSVRGHRDVLAMFSELDGDE